MLSSFCSLIRWFNSFCCMDSRIILTLVDISLGVVGLLVLLVTESVDGSVGTGAQLGVGVLGDVLVGLLGSGGTGALDGLGDVVGGVLEGCQGYALGGNVVEAVTNLDGLHGEVVGVCLVGRD